MLVKMYQDSNMASVRIFCDKIEADEHHLKLYIKDRFLGSMYFHHDQDCHHIEIGAE